MRCVRCASCGQALRSRPAGLMDRQAEMEVKSVEKEHRRGPRAGWLLLHCAAISSIAAGRSP
jgi:hypothetical protein